MGMDAGDLLFCIAQTGELLKKQFFHNAGENLQEVAGKLQELLLRFSQEYQGKDEETRDILQASMDTIGAVIGAMENQDYILCADLLETELYPIVELILQSLEEPESPVPDGGAARDYRLERARSGDLTIKTKGDPGFYLHSRGNPRREARVWIDGILELGKEAYVVFGIGLGYHVEAIYEKVAGRSRIEVYETDREMIRLAYEYGRMKKINGDSVKAVHDWDGRLFAEAISGRDVQIIMHYPSIKKIEDRNIRASFEKFFISDSTVKETKDLMFMNYKSNTALCRHNADGILPEIEGKKVIIVAAGPSLDKNVHLLKKENRDFIIIAVGTVFGKLVRMGIIPDYVAFMDAQERTFRQMEEVLPFDLSVPIIVESTACWRFIKYYKGPSYIAYQKGYGPAEKAAEEEKAALFETGGTVTSLAFDVAIKGRAETIIVIGMDLAYTGGVTHAQGTMDHKQAETAEEVEVPGYYGGTVRTKIIFNMYREWMEERIARVNLAARANPAAGNAPSITFVNATEGGAYINGMKHEELAKWI